MKRVSPLLPAVALGIVALACSENPTATDPGTPPDVVASSRASAGAASTYVILYNGTAVPRDAAKTIAGAGGTLVERYDAIGVAIARSSELVVRRQDREGQEGRGCIGHGRLRDPAHRENAPPPGRCPAAPRLPGTTPCPPSVGHGADPCPRGPRDQRWEPVRRRRRHRHWTRLYAPRPGAERGLREQRLLRRRRRESYPAAWADDNGHGTHTAGTIAAAKNDIGIVGVAPNVKIAAIKAGTAAGFFFPEAVICAFMWAGSHHLDVTNNSYFADPWLFNCRNDPDQRAIWKAEQRAIRYAMQQGVTVVAALTNQNQDLSKRNIDEISPDNGTPQSHVR